MSDSNQLILNERYINVYKTGQNYAGPEEGGWYAQYREPIISVDVQHLCTATKQELADTLYNLYRETYDGSYPSYEGVTVAYENETPKSVHESTDYR